MNSVSVGLGSIENMLSALQSIGFTIDSENNTAKWGYDTNNKLYFKLATSSSNITFGLYNSSNTAIWGTYSYGNTYSFKMLYERIGNSIVFGFVPSNASGNCVHFAVVAPTSENDDWLYVMPYIGSGAIANKIANGKTESVVGYSATSLYSGSANGIQICKWYDGYRFADNLYLCGACASVPACSNFISSRSNNNYVEATIGTDTYLVINALNAENSTKIAIKKVS